MSHNVKITVFEGPFDLLLHLVRVNEMDIYDIPISDITDQYLKYIKEMEKLDLRLAGEFLVMAATLINLKSRTLMPPLRDEPEPEEEEPEDELGGIRTGQDLMRQLIEYRQFKEMAVSLADRGRGATADFLPQLRAPCRLRRLRREQREGGHCAPLQRIRAGARIHGSPPHAPRYRRRVLCRREDRNPQAAPGNLRADRHRVAVPALASTKTKS